MNISIWSKYIGTLMVWICFGVCLASSGGQQSGQDSIGIFDLKAIRSVPLDPEVLQKTKQGDINIEQIRFTSLPGIRIYAILTYKDGAKSVPGYFVVERFTTKPLIEAAKNGFFGIEVAPPTGNTDPKKMESVGGPAYHEPFSINDQFTPDKNQSYIYHYTVALLRAMDYLATRPEVSLSRTVITGYSWSGTPVALLHALDDRPAGFCTNHGLGYYVDAGGPGDGVPANLSRKLYEMYCPAAYAQYGTKPFYVGTALNDFYTKLDAIIETYNNMKSPKAFAYSPNRHHDATSRNEFFGFVWWQAYWQGFGDPPSTVGEGAFRADDGKLTYVCSVDSKFPLKHAEVMVSYGKPGNYMGRTWHRFPLVQAGTQYQCDIPIYDPSVPLYAIAQIETDRFGDIGNGPKYVDPSALGIKKANAEYPTLLFDPSQKDDLYIRTGTIEWSADGLSGSGSAIIEPCEEGTITFQNTDCEFWNGKKTLSIWLKGDGKPGPIVAYLVSNPNYYFEYNKKNFSAVELVGAKEIFANGWAEYVIPLAKIPNLASDSSIFINPGKRKLQIGQIALK